MKSSLRIYHVLLLGIAFFSLSLTSFPLARAESDTPAGAAIRMTPPAPVFDNAKRLEELAARRKQVADTIGKNSMLVLFSAEPRVYTNDVDFPFRQENNLFYLTNLNQKRITLVLLPSQTPSEILFLPRRSPAAETWTGHMYSPQEASQLSGIKEIWEAGEFEPFIDSLRKHEAYLPTKPDSILLSERPANTAAPSGSNQLIDAASRNEATLYLLANF